MKHQPLTASSEIFNMMLKLHERLVPIVACNVAVLDLGCPYAHIVLFYTATFLNICPRLSSEFLAAKKRKFDAVHGSSTVEAFGIVAGLASLTAASNHICPVVLAYTHI